MKSQEIYIPSSTSTNTSTLKDSGYIGYNERGYLFFKAPG